MGDALQDQLAALRREVGAGQISGECKQTADWCFGQLPALYDKFCQTNESRYGDEITRRIVAVLKELAASKEHILVAGKMAAHISRRLGLLHEQFGLPRLVLRLPSVAKVPVAKARRSAVKSRKPIPKHF
jgi:hypothetical protein